MDAIVEPGKKTGQPTQEEAEEAVRTLIRWAGDDPDREGLLETPARVARSYREFYAGYELDPEAVLLKTFEETGGYDEMVLIGRFPLRTSHGADQRTGSCRLYPE